MDRIRSLPKGKTLHADGKRFRSVAATAAGSVAVLNSAGIAYFDAVVPSEFSHFPQVKEAGKLCVVPVFFVEIEGQMRGVEGHAVFLQKRLPMFLKVPVLLRPPFDAVVDHEQLDIKLLRLLEGGEAGIHCKADSPDFSGAAGFYLKTVQRGVFNLFNPKCLVQETA